MNPKLFLDTNVCSKLLSAPYDLHYEDIKKRIGERYQMVVSTETLIEMMDILKGGNGEYFEWDVKRIRVMAGIDTPTFLPSVGEFSLRQSLGIEQPAKFQPNDFEKWYRVITSASSRTQLFEYGVRWKSDRFKINPAVVVDQQRAGKDSYREWLEICRTGRAFPPPERWAWTHARPFNLNLTLEQALKLGNDLSAAYEFSKSQFGKAKNDPKFKVDAEARQNDWVDGQQLMYLCDPTLHMLTDDSRIKSECSASPQSERIFLLPQFVSDLGI